MLAFFFAAVTLVHTKFAASCTAMQKSSYRGILDRVGACGQIRVELKLMLKEDEGRYCIPSLMAGYLPCGADRKAQSQAACPDGLSECKQVDQVQASLMHCHLVHTKAA